MHHIAHTFHFWNRGSFKFRTSTCQNKVKMCVPHSYHLGASSWVKSMCSRILEMTRHTKSGSGLPSIFVLSNLCLLVVGIVQIYAWDAAASLGRASNNFDILAIQCQTTDHFHLWFGLVVVVTTPLMALSKSAKDGGKYSFSDNFLCALITC